MVQRRGRQHITPTFSIFETSKCFASSRDSSILQNCKDTIFSPIIINNLAPLIITRSYDMTKYSATRPPNLTIIFFSPEERLRNQVSNLNVACFVYQCILTSYNFHIFLIDKSREFSSSSFKPFQSHKNFKILHYYRILSADIQTSTLRSDDRPSFKTITLPSSIAHYTPLHFHCCPSSTTGIPSFVKHYLSSTSSHLSLPSLTTRLYRLAYVPPVLPQESSPRFIVKCFIHHHGEERVCCLCGNSPYLGYYFHCVSSRYW